jgi:hypothetical protein
VSNEQFYFDDFFATDEDAGITVPVKIRGRQVPITLKRGMTLADKMACQAVALKKRIVGGQVIVDGIDEQRLVEEMLVRQILDWPFTDRATGEKIPVTLEHLRNLRGGADELAEAIKKLDEEGEAALVPFVPASDEA